MRLCSYFSRLLILGGVLWLQWDLWQDWYLWPGLKNFNPTAIFLTVGLLILLSITFIWAVRPKIWAEITSRIARTLRRVGKLRWLMLLLWLVAFPTQVLFSPVAGKFESLSARWLLYIVFSWGTVLLLASGHEEDARFWDVLRGFLLTGAVFAFLAAYVNVSSYPFPTSWSEGNRLWDYSLMFARNRYLYPADQPIFAHIDPGRQFLWGLVYLIPGVGIFGVRLWSAMLFSLPYLLLAWAVFSRPREARPYGVWAMLWGFLFLSQGPIYTPLLLCALLVWFAVMWAPLWLGVFLTGIAGYYASVTRYTWLLAPPFWALMLALGIDQSPRRGWWRSHAILLGGAGLLGSLFSGRWQNFMSTGWALVTRMLIGEPLHAQEGAGFAARQPLIWSRLWPNPTFAPGIVLGMVLAVGPLVALWWLWHRQKVVRFPKRFIWLSAGGMFAFLAIGLVASLKIGGGSNLHNMDMFLITLLLLTGIAWQRGAWTWLRRRWGEVEQGVLLALALAPMMFVFLLASSRRIPEARWWRPALAAVQNAVHKANAQGGEILFMDHRHLLTFGFVEQVPLVPEYEKKYMMDQAMAGNKEYFEKYYQDLANHRFALIVTEPLVVRFEEEGGHNFASENNAWVQWVTIPTLCYYEPVATFPAARLELLIPQRGKGECSRNLP